MTLNADDCRAACGALIRWLGIGLVFWWPLQGLSAEADRVIVVGGDHHYPPYEFINEDGDPDGYNTELTLAIAEVMGIDVEIRLGAWDDIRRQLDQGQIDIVQGIVQSKTRQQYYAFSPPHAIVHQSIFARKGDPAVSGLNDLNGKSVIVQSSGAMHDYLRHQQPGADLVLVDSHADALRLLSSGQYDYALVANLPGLYTGKALELSNLIPVGKPLGAQHYGYAVLKGNEDLLAQFSEGLAILKNTGRQQAIYDKWLGPLENQGFSWKQLGMAAAMVSAILLLVLGGIMIWNRALSREVAKRTEAQQLQQQQLIQADKMTSLGILVSGMAHEINNPSSLLLLNLPILKESYQDAEEILEAYYQQHGDFMMGGLSYSRMRDEIPSMLDDMLAGTQRIRRIVEDLRDFARQEPTDLSEVVDLNGVTAAAIRLVERTLSQSTQHFSVSYGESLPTFEGNGQRIEQVIINLMINACQALSSPEQAIRVRTYFHSAEQQLRLEICDQGKGIAPEHLPRLSDPFFTTKREQGGTGLGLSISFSIVNEHGGNLTYDSTLQQGTCVTLSLPALKGTTVS
ncbi:transporter substrate-binding domain-containing protein [Photobacterium galatheae]|uniref:histidine kinase n=1 Tax=Photobacterium galatheae TaxID=1654360 RepID=A0A066RST2_9GAMM|nr:transporter substrate-binding domain-containing protein [Photobacterium galatheae]KDM93520.1 histidine kinase [Photobacterium galatheae]MCM0151344.1 transporter substrate-binding domain-containing protein [Photobacterium galatheae]